MIIAGVQLLEVDIAELHNNHCIHMHNIMANYIDIAIHT